VMSSFRRLRIAKRATRPAPTTPNPAASNATRITIGRNEKK